MQFIDILKKGRSSPTTALHKFLLNYDPANNRVHAFVEGGPDLAFYRSVIGRFVSGDLIKTYNCEGKAQVYELYEKIVERFPQSVRVMFFVDKDIDDIAGQAWPGDPRIFVTEVYSIENYLVLQDGRGAVPSRVCEAQQIRDGFRTDLC